LNLHFSTVSLNRAPAGNSGGVQALGPTTITNSLIENNTAGLNGGGMAISGNHLILIQRSTIRGNEANFAGGGMLNLGETIILESTINNNLADSGGGIQNSSAGNLTLLNSTVSGNEASGSGGGILFSGNSGFISNSTLAANSSPTQGANLYSLIEDAEVRSTIIANALGGAASCITNFGGQIQSLGYNLSDEASCPFNAPGDQPVANALLAPLADNGGPTATHALGEGSPAIDKGIASSLSVDQRGWPRIFNHPQIPNAPGGDGTDIGAFELQPVPDPIFADRFEP
jgi:hypothetical protein